MVKKSPSTSAGRHCAAHVGCPQDVFSVHGLFFKAFLPLCFRLESIPAHTDCSMEGYGVWQPMEKKKFWRKELKDLIALFYAVQPHTYPEP